MRKGVRLFPAMTSEELEELEKKAKAVIGGEEKDYEAAAKTLAQAIARVRDEVWEENRRLRGRLDRFERERVTSPDLRTVKD